jgi:hypothetical protein
MPGWKNTVTPECSYRGPSGPVGHPDAFNNPGFPTEKFGNDPYFGSPTEKIGDDGWENPWNDLQFLSNRKIKKNVIPAISWRESRYLYGLSGVHKKMSLFPVLVTS